MCEKACVQRRMSDEDMGIRMGASGKGSQDAGDGFLHPAVVRIAANLRVGVELEGKEEVRRMRAVRGPKGLSGTPSACGAAQPTQQPAPHVPAGALWAVCLKVPEKRPEKDGSRIMGDGPPCLDGLGIADFPGFWNVRASGGKFRHAFSGVRQGGKAVHAALFHWNIIRAQIPFLIGPNTDAPDFGQQDGLAVQWPPVPADMQLRLLFLIHESGSPFAPDRGLFPEQPGVGPGPVHHVAAAAVDADDRIPSPCQCPPQPSEKGTVRHLKTEMSVRWVQVLVLLLFLVLQEV